MTGETMEQVNKRYEEGKISVEDVTKAMQFASSEGGKFYQSMEKQSKTLNGQLSTLKDNWGQLVGAIAKTPSGFLTKKILPEINNLLASLQESFEGEGLQGLVQTLLNWLVNLAVLIAEQAPLFITAFNEIMINVINSIIENLPIFLQSGIDILMALINGLISAIPQLIPVIFTALQTMSIAITNNLPMIIDAGIKLIFALIDGILNNLDKVIMIAIDVILALALGLLQALPLLLEKVPEIIIKLVKALTEPKMLAKLISAALDLILALAGGLIKALPQLILMVPQIILEIGKSLSDTILKTDWGKLGKDILNGLLNGLIDFGTVVKDTVKKVGKKITTEIKNFFGIASPSKLMKNEVGKYLPEGIAVGIEANTDSALKSIDNMNEEIMNRMRQAVNIETGKSSFSGTNGSVTQILSANGTTTVNLNNETYLDGEKVYENQKVVSAKKDLQYQFA